MRIRGDLGQKDLRFTYQERAECSFLICILRFSAEFPVVFHFLRNRNAPFRYIEVKNRTPCSSRVERAPGTMETYPLHKANAQSQGTIVGNMLRTDVFTTNKHRI